MNIPQIKETAHDNRKVYPQVYAVKPGPVYIQQIPNLQYVSQEMNTAFHMDIIETLHTPFKKLMILLRNKDTK